jgi:Zn-dependent M28 family amino/carboxypeptidase
MRYFMAMTLGFVSLSGLSAVEPAASANHDVAGRIVGAALVESGAWDKLAYLTDRIGHRLAGSQALDRAIEWSVAEFRRDGIEHAWTEKVMVPHWVRGHGTARIMAPVETEMATLALGGSVGTAKGGIEAAVLEVSSFDELEAAGDAVQGKIVLFNMAMQAGWGVENGYGTVVQLRAHGASRAAQLGAVGMLIRSLGTADFNLPHTGALRYDEEQAQIPAAAVAVEDAELLSRLLASGDEVRVHLDLGCKMYDDVESANVLAEIKGSEFPEEIVLIGAHLDSWDVGQGAHDDGTGCAIVMETLRLLSHIEPAPRRTIRAVLFTNEENGLRGGRDYAERHGAEHHVAAIETDSGGFHPIGFGVTAGEGGVDLVRRITRDLASIDADAVFDGGGGADIGPLRKQYGVPVLGLRVQGERYFDYHHTAADTLDKVDRSHLDRNVAAMAVLTYGLAQADELLPRLEPEEEAAE